MSSDKLIHPEISEVIIGSAMKVLNTLKPGLDEKAYENLRATLDIKAGEFPGFVGVEKTGPTPM